MNHWVNGKAVIRTGLPAKAAHPKMKIAYVSNFSRAASLAENEFQAFDQAF
jgi:hypothetical protein